MQEVKLIVRGEPRPKGSKSAMVYNWPRGKNKGKVAGKIKALARQLLASPFSWHPQTSVREVSKHLGPWEKEVSKQAESAMAPYEGPIPANVPVRLVMEFFIARPKSHYGTGKNAGIIKDRFKKAMPLKVPDLSKLFRAAEDGLNEIVFMDDCQVVEMVSKKRYGRKNGVRITACPIDFETVVEDDPEQLLLFEDKEL